MHVWTFQNITFSFSSRTFHRSRIGLSQRSIVRNCQDKFNWSTQINGFLNLPWLKAISLENSAERKMANFQRVSDSFQIRWLWQQVAVFLATMLKCGLKTKCLKAYCVLPTAFGHFHWDPACSTTPPIGIPAIIRHGKMLMQSVSSLNSSTAPAKWWAEFSVFPDVQVSKLRCC